MCFAYSLWSQALVTLVLQTSFVGSVRFDGVPDVVSTFWLQKGMDIPGYDLNPCGLALNASNLCWASLARSQPRWIDHQFMKKAACSVSACFPTGDLSDVFAVDVVFTHDVSKYSSYTSYVALDDIFTIDVFIALLIRDSHCSLRIYRAVHFSFSDRSLVDTFSSTDFWMRSMCDLASGVFSSKWINPTCLSRACVLHDILEP